MHKIVGLYLGEEAARLQRLAHFALEQQSEELAQEAHSFGSNAVSFGSMQARRIALELENAARAADWPAVAERMLALRHASTRLKHELSQLGYN